MTISHSLANLFSLSGIGWLFIGVALTRAYYWIKCERWNRSHPDEPKRHIKFNTLIILWAMIFIFFVYQGVQQQETAESLRDLTVRTAQCQKEFFTQSKDRAQLNDQSDEWSRRKTQAIADWMHALTFPPPEMAARRQANNQDPVYQQWALSTTDHYFTIIDQAEREQEASLLERQQHPLPEPTCGK